LKGVFGRMKGVFGRRQRVFETHGTRLWDACDASSARLQRAS